jgi:hypothetical protein
MQLVYQDWNGWMQQGFLDMAVPMNYAREADARSRGFFDGWISWEKKNKHGRQLVVGVGSYLNSAEGTVAQVSRVRQPEGRSTADGVSFFSYGGLLRADTNPDPAKNSAGLSHLSAGPFATPAPVPTAPEITCGWLAGTVRDKSGTAVDGAIVEFRRAGWNPFRRTQKIVADGNGFFGASDLKPGRYEAVLTGAKKLKSLVEIQAGKVSRVELAAGQ